MARNPCVDRAAEVIEVIVDMECDITSHPEGGSWRGEHQAAVRELAEAERNKPLVIQRFKC
jgi:hypothetical protein